MAEPDHLARIWLTYKTRIISEQRFNNYALVSHLALSWYAFLSIVFSIYQSNLAKSLGEVGANQASLVISVLTFGLSLVIYGFKFEDAARTHRDCYLRMQSIYQSDDSNERKLEDYRKLLDHYPNHASRDYSDLLFDGWRSGRVLKGTDGLPIKFSNSDAAVCYARRVLWIVFIAIVFGLPPVLGVYWASGK